MAWWNRFLLNRAARRYARELGPWLARSYGASGTYTPAQVKAGLEHLGLQAEYASLGYAAFLTEPQFDQLVSNQPNRMTYSQARAVIQSPRRPNPPSAGGDAPEPVSIPQGWPGHDGHFGGDG